MRPGLDQVVESQRLGRFACHGRCPPRADGPRCVRVSVPWPLGCPVAASEWCAERQRTTPARWRVLSAPQRCTVASRRKFSAGSRTSRQPAMSSERTGLLLTRFRGVRWLPARSARSTRDTLAGVLAGAGVLLLPVAMFLPPGTRRPGTNAGPSRPGAGTGSVYPRQAARLYGHTWTEPTGCLPTAAAPLRLLRPAPPPGASHRGRLKQVERLDTGGRIMKQRNRGRCAQGPGSRHCWRT